MGSDKTSVIFSDLALKRSYQDRIAAIRKQFDIPRAGFKDGSKAWRWLFDLQDKGTDELFKKSRPAYDKMMAYDAAKKKLAKEFSIPPSITPLLDEKILCAKGIEIADYRAFDYGCALVDREERADKWRTSGKPFATLLIHKGANKRIVRQYIQDHWDEIERILNRDPQKAKRVVNRGEKSRDEIVFELCCMSSKELDVRKGLPREMRIQEILEKEYRIKMSESNIKRICAEQRSRRR